MWFFYIFEQDPHIIYCRGVNIVWSSQRSHFFQDQMKICVSVGFPYLVCFSASCFSPVNYNGGLILFPFSPLFPLFSLFPLFLPFSSFSPFFPFFPFFPLFPFSPLFPLFFHFFLSVVGAYMRVWSSWRTGSCSWRDSPLNTAPSYQNPAKLGEYKIVLLPKL